MRAGVSTATLFGRLYNEDAVPLLAEWKAGCAEVFLTSFSEYSRDFGKLLAERKGDLPVHSVHVLNTQFEPQLYSDHPRVREDAFLWLARAMEAAQELGAHFYTFHGLARLKRTFRENVPRTAAKTREIAEFCARYGVTLSYENVEWAFIDRPEAFRALKKEYPALHGVLDVKQARISGYDWREYLKAMEGCLTHVHVSDVRADGGMCLPGRGTFDFDELFSRLRDAGFGGPVILENYGNDYGDFGEVKASLEFLAEKAEKYSVK